MAKPIRTYYLFTDAKGNEFRVVIHLPASTTYANVETFVHDMADLLMPLSGAAFKEAGFGGVVVTGSVPAEPGSDIQERAMFEFETANNFLLRFSIPAVLEELFSPGSEYINTLDADVAAFVAAMENGLTVNATVVQPCDSRGDDIAYLSQAQEEWGRPHKS